MSELKKIVENIKNKNFINALKLCEIYKNEKNKHIIFNLKGVIFLSQNKFEEAEINFLESQKINDAFIDPVKNLFLMYFKKNDSKKILIYAKKLVQMDKLNPVFNYQLGFALEQNFIFDEAIKYYKNCINYNGKDKIKALNNIGVIYSNTNKIKMSIPFFLEALKLNENDKFVVNNLLSNYLKLRDEKNSDIFFKKALNIDQNFIYFLYNKAEYLILKGQIESAIEILGSNKKELKFLIRLVKIYFTIGEKNKAQKLLQELKEIKSDNPDLLNFLGMRYLYEGDFDNGWKYYENRPTKLKNSFKDIKEWNGEKITNKNIAVYSEQGLGDAIQFSKYIIPLLKVSKNVDFLVQKKIINLFKKDIPNLRISALDYNQESKFEYKIALGSLIKFFYKEKFDSNDSIINHKDKFSKISIDNFDKKKLNVGIAWSGSFNGPNEPYRSIPLKSLKKIFTLDINFFSLQNEIWQRDLDTYNSTKMINLGNYSLNEIASIIPDLDLVISSDTSLLHLSASLNKETWGILNLDPDWRWGEFNKINPYNSLKLFHQKKFNEWEDVENDVFNNLKKKLIN
tara:strand:- start:55 stop:1761 length:1707 start_codon:yes stop_codon:yes gene_type:complete